MSADQVEPIQHVALRLEPVAGQLAIDNSDGRLRLTILPQPKEFNTLVIILLILAVLSAPA